MRTAFAILFGLLLSINVANAQPFPSAPPPVFKIVSSADKAKGVIVFRETTFKVVPEIREEVKIVNGMQVKQKVTVYVPVMEERQTAIKAADSRVITADGKQLPIDEVWKRVKANTVVLISGNGNVPDQAFLRVLNANAIIIIPPASALIPAPAGKRE